MTAAPGMVNSGIELRLRLLPGGEVQAEVLQSRPTGLARAFRGLAPDDLQARLPLVFSVCKQAQAAACAAALHASRGEAMPDDALIRYDCRVAVETLFEAVRALSLGWPGMFGIPPDSEVAAVHSRGAALLAALSKNGGDADTGQLRLDYAEACSAVLFGADGDLPADIDALGAWARRRPTAAAGFFDIVLNRDWAKLELGQLGFLEDSDPALLLARLTGAEGENFAARPDLDGVPAETGALPRCCDHGLVRSVRATFGSGLVARLAAKLAEAGRLAEGLLRGVPEIMAGQPAVRAVLLDGWGAGIVHSARGMLIHTIRVEGGKVANFRILAPTEWNFHPQGAVVRALEALGRYAGLANVGDPVRLASLVAGAYDPCVPCNVLLERAEASHA